MIKKPLPEFKPGMKSFSASKMNNLVEAVQLIDRRQDIGTTALAIRNITGADLPVYSVLAYGDSVNDPTANISGFLGYVILDGDTPDENTSYGKFAVIQESAVDGQTVPCIIQGITQVKINVINANHMYADVTDAESGYLTSADSGTARILWKESGTGEKWAIVLIGGPMDDYLLVYNSSGVVIPANAATEVDSIDQNNGAHKLIKPSDDSLSQVIITDDFDIAMASYALVKKTYPKKVLYNSTAPIAGDTLGTVSGQWYMQTNKTGFQSNGSISVSGVALVSPFNKANYHFAIARIDFAGSVSNYTFTTDGADQIHLGSWVTLSTPYNVLDYLGSIPNTVLMGRLHFRSVMDSNKAGWEGTVTMSIYLDIQYTDLTETSMAYRVGNISHISSDDRVFVNTNYNIKHSSPNIVYTDVGGYGPSVNGMENKTIRAFRIRFIADINGLDAYSGEYTIDNVYHAWPYDTQPYPGVGLVGFMSFPNPPSNGIFYTDQDSF